MVCRRLLLLAFSESQCVMAAGHLLLLQLLLSAVKLYDLIFQLLARLFQPLLLLSMVLLQFIKFRMKLLNTKIDISVLKL
jgi:hypothetical protein